MSNRKDRSKHKSPGSADPRASSRRGSVLDVADAWMGYGESIVIAGQSLTARAGDIIALTGPNGSGKSTLLRGLAGLQPMACETYELFGSPTSVNSREHRIHTFAVFDPGAWLRDLTLRDHLETLAAPGNATPTGTGSYTPDQALEALGLTHLADRLPHTLSSGQRQRASLSLALVRPWSLLFLDEPEQRLDALFQEVLAETLVDLVEGDRAIVMATHSPLLIERCHATEIALEGEFHADTPGHTDPEARAKDADL